MKFSAILALISLCTPAFHTAPTANPIVVGGNMELQEALLAYTSQDSTGDCTTLAALLSRRYESGIRDLVTLALIRNNMARLELCILESQASTTQIDRSIHGLFRVHASEDAVSSMCDLLRSRLVLPKSLVASRSYTDGDLSAARRAAERPTRDLVFVAEALSEYGDSSSRLRLSALIDSLSSVSADTLWSGYNQPVSWYLRYALQRVDEPKFGTVFEMLDDGTGRFHRSQSEIVAVRLRSYPGSGTWQSADVRPADLQRIIAVLETGHRSQLSTMIVLRTVGLQLTFSDGVVCTISAYSNGSISIADNTSLDAELQFENKELADAILGLVPVE